MGESSFDSRFSDRHSDQKTCGKDGVHPQGAFVKLGGYAFSTFSIDAFWPFLTRGGAASNMYTVLWNIRTFPPPNHPGHLILKNPSKSCDKPLRPNPTLWRYHLLFYHAIDTERMLSCKLSQWSQLRIDACYLVLSSKPVFNSPYYYYRELKLYFNFKV